MIINAFENVFFFPLSKEPQLDKWAKEKKQTEYKSDKKERAKDDVKEFSNSIFYKEKGINRELFIEYFNFQATSFILKDLLLTSDKKKKKK